MKLAQLMTRSPEVVSPDDSVREAARRMAERGVGVLPVCDGKRLVGVVTDRDLVVRSVAQGENPNRVRVAEAMTTGPLYCYEDHSLREVGRRMQGRQIRRLVVLDRKKNLVGIVSIGDIARANGNGPLVARTLEEVSRPEKESVATSRSLGGRAKAARATRATARTQARTAPGTRGRRATAGRARSKQA
jgi:CBS domain-containing protein